MVSNLGVNNFAQADAVLRACKRVLRADGRLVLTTNLVGHMQEFYDAFHDTLEELGLRDLRPALKAHVEHRATVEATQRQLEAAGFAVEHVETQEFHMRFADGAALFEHHFIRLGFVPAWIDLLPSADAPRVFKRLVERLDERAADDGELSLTIPMALMEARPA